MNFTLKTLNFAHNDRMECTILSYAHQLPKSSIHMFSDVTLNDEGLIEADVDIYKTPKNGKLYSVTRYW